MKKEMEPTANGFRPNMSLSLAKMTKNPCNRVNRFLHDGLVADVTSEGQQVPRDDPAALGEAVQIIGYGNQRSRDYRNFEGHHEDDQ